MGRTFDGEITSTVSQVRKRMRSEFAGRRSHIRSVAMFRMVPADDRASLPCACTRLIQASMKTGVQTPPAQLGDLHCGPRDRCSGAGGPVGRQKP